MFRCFTSISLALLAWPAAPAFAQAANFHGPLSGFVYSRGARSVRPLLGVSGAARIGSPVLNDVDFAAIGPDGKWAVVTKAGHAALLNGLSDLNPADASPDGLIDAVDRVVWNRDGSAALLYSSTGNQLQRVKLAGAGATVDSPIDLSPWGTASVLAIDPAGRQIAFGVNGSGLYRFPAGQSPVQISSMAQPAAAAFDGTGKRLYAFDADQQQISAFDDGAGAAVFASLAQPDSPAVTAVGLAVSGDGRYLMLADSAAQAVRVYETASGNPANTIALDFVPSRFDALSAAPAFLLNGDRSGEWLLVLDASQTPAVSFVPASQEDAQ